MTPAATRCSTIWIKGIAFTGYRVSDLGRAQALDEGLRAVPVSTTFEHEGRGWIEHDVGAATLAITKMAPEAWKPSSEGRALAFEVEDLDDAVSALGTAGVTFYVQPMASGVCSLAVAAIPTATAWRFIAGMRERSAQQLLYCSRN